MMKAMMVIGTVFLAMPALADDEEIRCSFQGHGHIHHLLSRVQCTLAYTVKRCGTVPVEDISEDCKLLIREVRALNEAVYGQIMTTVFQAELGEENRARDADLSPKQCQLLKPLMHSMLDVLSNRLPR